MSAIRRLAIGRVNIASMFDDYAVGFRAHDVELVRFAGSEFEALGNPCDLIAEAFPQPNEYSDRALGQGIRTLQVVDAKDFQLTYAVARCDGVLVLWNSFRPDLHDLELFKRYGKKVVVVCVGDDVRWEPAATAEFSRYGLDPIEYDVRYFQRTTLESQLRYLRTAERHADLIIANRNNMQLALRPYLSHRIPVDVSRLGVGNTQRAVRPRIMHAPSHRLFKGTAYVLEAIEELRRMGVGFDFDLIEGMPPQEALAAYRECDILIDQLLCPGGGKLSLEGLAMNRVVVSLNPAEYAQPHAMGSPIVSASRRALVGVLRELIADVRRREELATLGRAWVVAHHDPARVCGELLDHLSGKRGESALDNRPSFFREQYLPRHAEDAAVANRLTKEVRDCDWYQRLIPGGERAGLWF